MSKEEYKGAIEVSVIFHENQRMFAVPKQVAQREPVGRLESDPYEGHVFVPRIDGDWSMLGKDLYNAPPAQRTWVGLRDEELQWIYDHGRTPAGMMEMVEAKLKEKNENRN